jgi:hypothetical protein
LEASAAFLNTHVFHINPHQKILWRFVRLFIAFYFTALVHLPGVVILGGSPFDTGVQKFFLMQAVGIVIESIVFSLWTVRAQNTTNGLRAGRMTKLLGYMWVLAWTTWTGPSFTWIISRMVVQGRDDVVPLSFLKWLGYGGVISA